MIDLNPVIATSGPTSTPPQPSIATELLEKQYQGLLELYNTKEAALSEAHSICERYRLEKQHLESHCESLEDTVELLDRTKSRNEKRQMDLWAIIAILSKIIRADSTGRIGHRGVDIPKTIVQAQLLKSELAVVKGLYMEERIRREQESHAAVMLDSEVHAKDQLIAQLRNEIEVRDLHVSQLSHELRQVYGMGELSGLEV